MGGEFFVRVKGAALLELGQKTLGVQGVSNGEEDFQAAQKGRHLALWHGAAYF